MTAEGPKESCLVTGQLTLQLVMHEGQLGEFMISKGHKLHSQNVRRLVSQVCMHRTVITTPFSNQLSSHSPCLWLTCSFILYPTNTPSPLPSGRQIWDMFSSLLPWLPCKQILSLLQTSESQHFGFLCIGQNNHGLVTKRHTVHES